MKGIVGSINREGDGVKLLLGKALMHRVRQAYSSLGQNKLILCLT